MSPIKFGTSGWRGIIADEFTFANVELVSQAIAQFLKSELKRKKSPIHGRKPEIIIGYDTRFLGLEFCTAAATILSENGLQPLLCNRDTPTPVISHQIRHRKSIGGLNMTASHNPFAYQGLKFSVWNGAAAPPEVTQKIESIVESLIQKGWKRKTNSPTPDLKTFDPKPIYKKQIQKLIDFDTIKKAKLKVAVELMYGTGRGYLDEFLTDAGAEIIRFHEDPDPRFGGGHPEPNEHGMHDAIQAVRSQKLHLALGLDGDADRFGIVDRDGTWLTPNQILPLALYHLKHNRGWTGSAVRTVPTSHQVDAVARLLNVPMHETPVGFKYIGSLMESEPIIVGGEESGGLSIKGHVPEKDGILACLLMAELVAYEGKSLGAILKNLEKETGPFFTDRINISIPKQKKEALLEKLGKGLEKIGSTKVQKFITLDGYKFLLPNDEWVAFRASGTEPLIRCYLEAKSARGLSRLKTACKKILAV